MSYVPNDYEFYREYRGDIFSKKIKLAKVGGDNFKPEDLISGKWYQRIDDDCDCRDFMGQFVKNKGNDDYVFNIIPPNRFPLEGHDPNNILLQFTLSIDDVYIATTYFHFEEIASYSNGRTIMLMGHQEKELEDEARRHWEEIYKGGRRTNKNSKKEVRKRKSRKSRKSRKHKKLRRKKTMRCSLDKCNQSTTIFER